jgi:hypothetical protein
VHGCPQWDRPCDLNWRDPQNVEGQGRIVLAYPAFGLVKYIGFHEGGLKVSWAQPCRGVDPKGCTVMTDKHMQCISAPSIKRQVECCALAPEPYAASAATRLEVLQSTSKRRTR